MIILMSNINLDTHFITFNCFISTILKNCVFKRGLNFKGRRKSRKRVCRKKRKKEERKMWRLKIGEGGNDPYLFSTNNFVGRQTWEFDAEAGTAHQRDQVQLARQNFYQNRFQTKACADRLWRFQVLFYCLYKKINQININRCWESKRESKSYVR